MSIGLKGLRRRTSSAVAVLAMTGAQLATTSPENRILVAEDMSNIERLATLTRGEVAANEERRRAGREIVHVGLHQGRTFTDFLRIFKGDNSDIVFVGPQSDFDTWAEADVGRRKSILFTKYNQGSLNYHIGPVDLGKGSDAYMKAMLAHSDPNLADNQKAYVDTAAIEPAECRGSYPYLHATMVMRLRDRGAKVAYGLCHADNPLALAAHEKCGYKPKGTEPITIPCYDSRTGKTVQQLLYVLELDLYSKRQDELIAELVQATAQGVEVLTLDSRLRPTAVTMAQAFSADRPSVTR